MHILKVLETRDDYAAYSKFINSDVMVQHEKYVFDAVGKFFEDHPSDDTISWSSFGTYVIYGCSYSVSDNDAIQVGALCANLDGVDTSGVSKTDIIKGFVDKRYGLEVGTSAFAVAEGAPGVERTDVVDLVDQWTLAVTDADPEEDHTVLIDDDFLADVLVAPEGLQWELPALQECFGPLSAGLIVIGSRPDSGKTTMLLREALNFTPQLAHLGKSVCFFGNEENIKSRIIPRVACMFGGYSPVELLNPSKKVDILMQFNLWNLGTMNGTFKFYNSESFNCMDIENFAEKNNAGAIFIDQLGSVEGYESTRHSGVDRFALVCKHLRRIGDDICPVIGTVWADFSAEGVAYINMAQLYGSKTALQGNSDAVLTLGKVDNTPTRYLSCVKNKLPYGDPLKANGKWELTFDPIMGTWKVS
jgi:hypothetical protein